MRGRGLKRLGRGELTGLFLVAPHAGAWIETANTRPYHLLFYVAPHAGAWIETIYVPQPSVHLFVAPHAGAWIETRISKFNLNLLCRSPPMRGRGLKLSRFYDSCSLDSRPPCGGVD